MPGATASGEYSIENGAVVALQGGVRQKLPIPENVTAVLAEGHRLYVARGQFGVTVYDVSSPTVPRVVGEQRTEGAYASGFAVLNGEVWVLLTSKSAIPVALSTSIGQAAAPADAIAANTSAANAEARGATGRGPAILDANESDEFAIRLVSPGVIEIMTGGGVRTKIGDRFSIYRADERRGSDDEHFPSERFVGNAEVVAVRDNSCLAELSRMATARPDDYARRSRRTEEERNVVPTRVANMGEYSAVLRPLLNIGSPLGVGVLADLEASYWGGAYFAGLTVQPLGIGTTADGSIVSIAALAEGGYDGKSFSVGLGAGVGWVNGSIDDMLDSTKSYASSSSGTTTTQDTHSAFAVSQVVRLGARDGLRLHLRNVLMLHRESYSSERGFIYGGTTGKFAIPTGRTADVFVEGGGGVMGYWFFGLGVGTWLVGNGSPGSLHLAVSAGGAGIYGSRRVIRTSSDYNGGTWTYTFDENFGVAGPMVSIGLTRRFEF